MSHIITDTVYKALDAIMETNKQNITFIGYEINHEISLGMSLLWQPCDACGKHLEYIGWNEFLKNCSVNTENTQYVIIVTSTMRNRNEVITTTMNLSDIYSMLPQTQCIVLQINSKAFKNLQMWALFDSAMNDYIVYDYSHNPKNYQDQDEDFYLD